MMEDLGLQFAALQEIADVSTDSVVIYDLENRTVYYTNDAGTNLLGLHRGATQSDIESIFTWIAPADRAFVKNQYARLSKMGAITDVEFRLSGKQDDDVHLCCSAYHVADGSAIVAYVKDISRARQHEHYLVEFGARKNTLLDILMHQISGALNLMRHLSTEAAKYVRENDKQLAIYLKLLNDNNSHCLEMIEDLMKEEHERSPYVAVKSAKIDIIERIAIVHAELQQSYNHRTFIYEHTTDSLSISTDALKLLQVVNNLSSNAIKFSPPEKPIVMRITETPADVIFGITDFGIGIPEPFKPLIFERQNGIGRTGLNGEKSLGLGLFICKNLIHLLQGKIWFESIEGKGSTFFFSLPKD